jgi:hypothetical protein
MIKISSVLRPKTVLERCYRGAAKVMRSGGELNRWRDWRAMEEQWFGAWREARGNGKALPAWARVEAWKGPVEAGNRVLAR